MIEVFKTNVEQPGLAQEIIQQLNSLFPEYRVNFDLQDCDKILRIEGKEISCNVIREILTRQGIICEVLK